MQAFGCRFSNPDKYDLLMDVATEEFSHLEIVGATITMLLDGVNGKVKDAAETLAVTKLATARNAKDQVIAEAFTNPRFLTESAGGPMLTDANGVPWTGAFINANGDLTVDLRSNIGAETRAKIVYERLIKFTDDPEVRDTLRFLMTREITHFQQFTAALQSIEPNFPPGALQGDVRFTHAAFNMSKGEDARGPWNQGQGPWPEGEEWEYIADPGAQVRETEGQKTKEPAGHNRDAREEARLEQQIGKMRREEVEAASTFPAPGNVTQWSTYLGNGEEKQAKEESTNARPERARPEHEGNEKRAGGRSRTRSASPGVRKDSTRR
jgi:Mn-containing catalase